VTENMKRIKPMKRSRKIDWTAVLGTENHKKAIERLLKKKGFAELGRELNIHEDAIRSLVRRLKAKNNLKRGGNNRINWEAKLKPYPGKDIREKALNLQRQYKTSELSQMLGVAVSTIHIFFHNTIPEVYKDQSPQKKRKYEHEDYLKKLRAFMATPEGELVRKYNEIILKDRSTPSFHYLRSKIQ
jgi:hypothetical protein